jgi:predicted tellurium resistance membrane protein TerC
VPGDIFLLFDGGEEDTTSSELTAVVAVVVFAAIVISVDSLPTLLLDINCCISR